MNFPPEVSSGSAQGANQPRRWLALIPPCRAPRGWHRELGRQGWGQEGAAELHGSKPAQEQRQSCCSSPRHGRIRIPRAQLLLGLCLPLAFQCARDKAKMGLYQAGSMPNFPCSVLGVFVPCELLLRQDFQTQGKQSCWCTYQGG